MSLRNKKCVQIKNNKVKKSNKKNRTKSLKNNNRKKYNNSIKKIRKQFAGMKNFENLAGISEYLNSRPKLVGVGTEPKLIINGVLKSTGIVDD